MDEKFVLTHRVAFAEVDRDEFMSLAGVFRLLQEAAIGHANQFAIGTRTHSASTASWVLNRMAVGLQRYPRFEDALRIETWSRGITGFRGYREYRIYCEGDCIVSCSSLWIYIDLQTKTPTRLPADVVSTFPTLPGEAYNVELDRLARIGPEAEKSRETCVTVRYSDLDTNQHVNNASYLDFLQTAAAAHLPSPRPNEVQVKFMREIRPDAATVRVLLQPDGASTLFSIGVGDSVCAQGTLGHARGMGGVSPF